MEIKQMHLKNGSKRQMITVMKFGGSSLGTAERILHVAHIIERAPQEQKKVVIVSAVYGITDRLIGIFELAKKGDYDLAKAEFDSLVERHERIVAELQLHKLLHIRTEESLQQTFNQLKERLFEKKKYSKKDYDFCISFGERLSSLLVATALEKKGMKSQAVNSAEVIVVTNNFNNAKALLPQSVKKASSTLLPLLEKNIIPVVTGFFGQTRSGSVALLGRGGSDYSATILGNCLNASEVILWKEVNGVYSNDPKRDPYARFLPELTYEVALKMAQKGAKILHPEAMKPVLSKRIPVWVKNTFNPTFPGTKIWGG